jgi:hypothetical protein
VVTGQNREAGEPATETGRDDFGRTEEARGEREGKGIGDISMIGDIKKEWDYARIGDIFYSIGTRTLGVRIPIRFYTLKILIGLPRCVSPLSHGHFQFLISLRNS